MKLRRSNNNSINSKKIHFGESPNDVLFMRLAFHTMRKFVTIFSFFKSRKNFSSSLHRNSPRCSNQLHPNFRNLTQNCDLLLPPLSSHRLFSDIAGNPSTLNRNLLQDQVLFLHLPPFHFSTIPWLLALSDLISLFALPYCFYGG